MTTTITLQMIDWDALEPLETHAAADALIQAHKTLVAKIDTPSPEQAGLIAAAELIGAEAARGVEAWKRHVATLEEMAA
jgi:hypothetical protein